MIRSWPPLSRLHLVAEPTGYRLLELVAVLDRLRSPGGCPWDARQTHESLIEYLIEETYETVEAIESGNSAHMREELGDLLLQVIFHARIAADAADSFDIDDVAVGIIAKLISRHPHVFADGQANTAAEVEANWHRLKVAEKGRSSVTEGVPEALPALLRAAKLHARAASGGVSVVPASQPVLAVAEAAWDSVTAEAPDRTVALGDLLLVLALAAKDEGIDAEAALRAATRRYADRLKEAELS